MLGSRLCLPRDRLFKEKINHSEEEVSRVGVCHKFVERDCALTTPIVSYLKRLTPNKFLKVLRTERPFPPHLLTWRLRSHTEG